MQAVGKQDTPKATGHWLTVDQGNSATKLVVWEAQPKGPVVLERLELKRGEVIDAATERRLEQLALRGIALSSVASSEDREALLEAGLKGLVADETIYSPSCGLSLAVKHPETLGTDRRFAARGAIELAGSRRGVLIVVDAGTALTVDSVRDGVFLGGAIAPGPALLAEALARGGAHLFRVQPDPGASALGRASKEALEAGVAVGFRGAAKELVLGQLGDPALVSGGAPLVFLTGGAREFLLTPEPFVNLELLVEPDLVHRGLLAALWSELGLDPT